MTISRKNNFDLIRLLASLQVLIWHGAVHLGVFDKLYNFLALIYHFPGVPIFFTISGFLISYSLDRNNFQLKTYFKNRAFRIYPALWVCTLIVAILLIVFNKYGDIKSLVLWILAQITFAQFYSPVALKGWGVGNPNGSLWSIAVELQFYIILPVLLYLVNRSKNLKMTNVILAIFFIISIVGKWYIQKAFPENSMISKVFNITVFNYLHFFLTGIVIYKNFDWLRKYLEGKMFYWLLLYVIYVIIFQVWLHYYETPYDISIWGIIANTILSLLTLAFAFSFTDLSQKLLHENDISYGLYIYHMPIVNTMLTLGISGSILHVVLLLVCTVMIALLSWKLIEQPILKLK